MRKLFGTDGMRGEAGRFPLDVKTVHVVGRSLAQYLIAQLGRAPYLITGRDTRESGEWIERALIAGAREAGVRCDSAGVIPTPGVAYLTRALPADAGVVISASHNPYQDNGIKIFAPSGRKLDDAAEQRIERDIYAAAKVSPANDEHAGPLDKAATESSEEDLETTASLKMRYLTYLVEEIGANLNLNNLRIVVDAANGAASQYAPALFTKLGAQTVTINDHPDGRNINRDCGSLHLDRLQRKVVEETACFGVAFDGDADRALFVDEHGEIVDGDATLWVMTQWLTSRGELTPNCVVATVMSNIGLEAALHTQGIELVRTDVGDKYVLDELLRTRAALGGEQSGHIIFPRLSLAGDGMVTTLLMLRAMRDTGLQLSDLTKGFVRYPQVLVNVTVREKRPFHEVPELGRHVQATKQELGTSGRLLLRYSGTEPLARIMIEGQELKHIEALANKLAAIIKQTLG